MANSNKKRTNVSPFFITQKELTRTKLSLKNRQWWWKFCTKQGSESAA